MTETKPCMQCGGTGRVTDIALSVALGVSLHMGYLPMTSTCSRCGGSGRIPDTTVKRRTKK